MRDTDIRQISEACAATRHNAAPVSSEPSHIHIPRPSRLARMPGESAPEPAQLELTLQEAA